VDKLIILGAGGFAREVAWLVSKINNAGAVKIWNIVGFLETTKSDIGRVLNGIPIISSDVAKKYLPDLYAVVAIGNPKTRQQVALEAREMGCKFTTLIHPKIDYDEHTVTIGPGSIVCAGNILTVNIRIGEHVIVNLDCTIGHDTIIEDYVTMSPGCHLSGHTTIRRGAFLGSGVVTVEGHEIGANSIIGAGACVTNDIPPNVIAVGVPARPKI
jgi:sugar O-acyltransferase (sialic acid O-acetyltransferase NeuD family)